MIGTAIILGLVTAALIVIEYAGGRNFITQPIMAGTVVGLLMGDLRTCDRSNIGISIFRGYFYWGSYST